MDEANRRVDQLAEATPMTPAEARRSANEMSRQINETRASQGLPRRGRPPGSRTMRRLRRGGELPAQLNIPGFTPIPVIQDRVPISGSIRTTPRRMFQSDFSNSSEDDLDSDFLPSRFWIKYI